MDRSTLTKAQRWAVADVLAEERLPSINAAIDSVQTSKTFYARFGKRAIDFLVSSAALVVTAPINAFLAVATFIDVGCPILFSQVRTGLNGAPFTIYKFRNMTNSRDERGELLPPEQRVTAWGHFVRKTSLDELLNFWNVFKGEMSIIGPRPLPPEYAGRYNKRHYGRLSIRPGLECPPKDAGSHLQTWQEQFDNDAWYAENVSFKTDCMMLINLVKYAFSKKSAEARASANRGIFMGYNEDGIAITLEDISDEYIEHALKEEQA